jgi:D-beta-D-heptose 7-phosphate kinase/D-beta-D-heptose 1-phosphate adenosyltransferase
LKEILISKAISSDLVIVSDYGKGFVSDDLLRIIRENAPFVSIDPKPSRLLNYKNPDLLTPNRLEALELAGKSRLTTNDFPKNEVVEEIFKKFSPSKLAITLGSDGMLLAEDGDIKETIPTAAREVFDVSGAGDTVIAVLSMALVSNGTFEESARLANLAAGIVVGKVGTASVTTEEILTVL